MTAEPITSIAATNSSMNRVSPIGSTTIDKTTYLTFDYDLRTVVAPAAAEAKNGNIGFTYFAIFVLGEYLQYCQVVLNKSIFMRCF